MSEEPQDTQSRRLVKIEDSIDRDVSKGLMVAGTARFTNMLEVMEFAKLLSTAQKAVPKHLRANPGGCLAVALQAMDWGMSPIALANKSYEVNDRVAYEAQAIHAAIEMSGKLVGRLKRRYEGEGPTRKCIVWARIKGEEEDSVHESPMVKDFKVKNSPLWQSKPDVQLFYNTSRDWARVFLPEVILGVYAIDELQDSEELRATQARDVTPGTGLAARLTSSNGDEGYKEANVDALTGAAGGGDELANIAADVPNGQQQPHSDVTEGQVTTGTVTDTAPAAATPEPTAPKAEPDKPKEPEKPKEKKPKTAEEYLAFLTEWLARTTDDARIHDRWAEEKKLRTACGVMGDDLTKGAQMRDARLHELGAI